MAKGNNKTLMILAVVAVIVAVASASLTYLSLSNLLAGITGLPVGPLVGTVNLTINSFVQANFTKSVIDFGDGIVDPQATAASLITTGGGTVTGGNWSARTGLALENIGNVNVSLNFTFNSSTGSSLPSSHINGTGPVFEFNVTNNETGSCLNRTGCTTCTAGLQPFNVFYPVNDSWGRFHRMPDGAICPIFRFEAANDNIRIDFNITIPQDAPPGQRNFTLAFTVTAL